MRTIVAALCIGILASATPAMGSSAHPLASSDGLTADLDGRPIKTQSVGAYYCHDFDYPHIHCYSTPAALEAEVGSGETGTYVMTAGASDYLTVYSEPMFGGSYAHLAQNYDGLWAIGWNDRISSFKVRNNASGWFFQDWYGGGWKYAFCCDAQATGLSGSYDNQFSSVYRN
jgi:hypothetical protein